MNFSFISILFTVLFVGSAKAFYSQSTTKNVLRTSSSLRMTILTANGQKVDFKEGSPLSSACAKLGVKPKYSCKRYVNYFESINTRCTHEMYTRDVRCMEPNHSFYACPIYTGEIADHVQSVSGELGLKPV